MRSVASVFTRSTLRFTPSLSHSTSSCIRSFSAQPKLNMTLVKALRDSSGAPITECKDAINGALATVTSGVDAEVLAAATDILRKKGIATANKKAGRSACEGLVAVRVTDSSKQGTLLEVNSETDFASRNDKFQSFIVHTSHSSLNAPVTSNGDYPIDTLTAQAYPIENKNVSTALTDLVTALRENIRLRRVARIAVNNGALGSYVHNGVDVSSLASNANVRAGRTGAIVAIESNKPLSPEQTESVRELASKLAMQVVAAMPKWLNKDRVPADVLAHERDVLKEQAKASGRDMKHLDKMIEGRLGKFYEEYVLLEQKYVVTGDNPDAKPTKVSNVVNELGKQLGATLTVNEYICYRVGEGLDAPTGPAFKDEVASKIAAAQQKN